MEMSPTNDITLVAKKCETSKNGCAFYKKQNCLIYLQFMKNKYD